MVSRACSTNSPCTVLQSGFSTWTMLFPISLTLRLCGQFLLCPNYRLPSPRYTLLRRLLGHYLVQHCFGGFGPEDAAQALDEFSFGGAAAQDDGYIGVGEVYALVEHPASG